MNRKPTTFVVAAIVALCSVGFGGSVPDVSAEEVNPAQPLMQTYSYGAPLNEPPWSLWYLNRFTGELHAACSVGDGSFNAWNNYYTNECSNTCAFTVDELYIGRELKPTIAFTAPESGEAVVSASLGGQITLRLLLGEEILGQVDEGVVADPIDYTFTLDMDKGETLYLCAAGGDMAADWQCILHIDTLNVKFTSENPVPVEADELMLEAGEKVLLTQTDGVTVTGTNDAVSYADNYVTALKAGNALLTLTADGYTEKKVYVGVKGEGQISDYGAWDYATGPRPAGEDNIYYFLYDQIACRYLPAAQDWNSYINQNKYSNETDWVVFSQTSYLNIPNNNTYDVALAYRVPASGYLSIDDDIAFMDPRDGTSVAVMLNAQRIFPAHLPWMISGLGSGSFTESDAARMNIRLYGIEVEEGDWIFLRFNCNIQGGANLEQVYPKTVFTLTPKEGT